jgi:dihydroxyacetone kinase
MNREVYKMTLGVSPKVTKNKASNIRVFQEAITNAENTVKASKEREKLALTVLQEALDKAQEISRECKEIAEAAVKASNEAKRRVEEISRETKEVTETALRALGDAIVIANQTSEAIKKTGWGLADAAKEAIEAPQRAVKERWMNG